MKTRTIKEIGRSDYAMMGDIRLRQPIPTKLIQNVDPFILLHHFGPLKINPNGNAFDVGPHPHRGFEPITFVVGGEQLHRDSLGNESIVKAGDVQWTTAGKGIIHAEGPSPKFLEEGGVLEGVQLWLNLPASKKMIDANYQHIKSEDMPVVSSEDGKVKIKVVSGQLENAIGLIDTQIDVNSFIVNMDEEGEYFFNIPESHNALVYLLSGKVETLNEELVLNHNQMVTYNNDGDGFNIKGLENSKLLVLTAQPLNEKVATYGPFVMNSQREIIEALNDYQTGKMGHLD